MFGPQIWYHIDVLISILSIVTPGGPNLEKPLGLENMKNRIVKIHDAPKSDSNDLKALTLGS